MARLPRLEVSQMPHLVCQSVIAGERLTRDPRDQSALLSAMLAAAGAHGVAVHAHALIGDGFYMVATPSIAGALSAFMQGVGRRYVASYNRRHGRQGSLWSGRYRATVLEAARYLLDAMAFVELAPWRKGDAASPMALGGGVSSSLAHHLGTKHDPLVTDHALFWALGNTPFERDAAWRRYLEAGQDAALASALTGAVMQGWALGDVAFISALQQRIDRPLVPRRRGRPRKVAALA